MSFALSISPDISKTAIYLIENLCYEQLEDPLVSPKEIVKHIKKTNQSFWSPNQTALICLLQTHNSGYYKAVETHWYNMKSLHFFDICLVSPSFYGEDKYNGPSLYDKDKYNAQNVSKYMECNIYFIKVCRSD